MESGKRENSCLYSLDRHLPAPLSGERDGRPAVSPGVRLLCFPYAGASAQIFRHWCQWLLPRIELIPMELPGRGFLVRQPPVERIDDLVDALVTAVDSLLDRPVALFGHGTGGLIAYELCRRLEATGRPLPKHFFVSAQRAPQLLLEGPRLHPLPRDQFIAAVRALRGTTAADLSGEETAEFLLPALRGDFKMMEDYQYRPSPPLDIPITIFGGIADQSVTPRELESWSLLTRRHCSLRWLPGSHFFVHEHQRLLAANLLRALEATGAPDPSPGDIAGFVTL
jgi:surfactin synthase thioesterase subunit